MQTVKTTLTTEAIFSDDGTKRYLLRKTWDESKPTLAIIMLVPSSAAGIELDSTTQLVLNNASRLGFGGIDILNLFSTLNDFALKEAEDVDADNIEAIIHSAEKAETLVYAAGTGKAKNKAFQQRQEQVLNALRPYESKLHCLTNESGKAPTPVVPGCTHMALVPAENFRVGLRTEKRSRTEAKKERHYQKMSKRNLPVLLQGQGDVFSWEHRKRRGFMCSCWPSPLDFSSHWFSGYKRNIGLIIDYRIIFGVIVFFSN